MKQMSKTLHSTIDTPILNKRGSFEVPNPENLVKWPPYHVPPLLPLRCISRWCKECPLIKRVNWIIAHNYGEPKCLFFQVKFS